MSSEDLRDKTKREEGCLIQGAGCMLQGARSRGAKRRSSAAAERVQGELHK